MKISIKTETQLSELPLRVGNVYPVKGGRGIRLGHMHVLIHIVNPEDKCDSVVHDACLMLVINAAGKPVGVNSYCYSYVKNLQPIAFVEGLEDLELVMRSL